MRHRAEQHHDRVGHLGAGVAVGVHQLGALEVEQHRHRLDGHDNLSGLVEDLEERANETAIGLGRRRPRFQHRRADRQQIARPHGLRPAQLVETRRRETRHVREVVIDDEAHHETCRLPSARNDAAELRLSRGNGVGVKNLRIVAAAELDNLLLGDANRAELMNVAGDVVLEKSLVD